MQRPPRRQGVLPLADRLISTINNIYSFSCDGYIQGYYADPEAECQTFHICANLELTGDLTKYGLLFIVYIYL